MELGYNFEGFQALYNNFLQINQQINLQSFLTIMAEDKCDNVSCAFEIIDHIFKQLSRLGYSVKQKKMSFKNSVDSQQLFFSSKKC